MEKIEEVPHLRSLFRQYGHDEANKIKLVGRIRDVAIEYLPPSVVAKVPSPYFSDEDRAAYAAKGISLEWNLTILGETGIYALCFAASDAGLNPSEKNAATLLRHCTKAIEDNSVSDQIQIWILDTYAGLDVGAVQKAKKFPPRRKKGAIAPATKYIHQLAIDNPDKKAKELYGKADKRIIGAMAEGTFANHVTKARNPKP